MRALKKFVKCFWGLSKFAFFMEFWEQTGIKLSWICFPKQPENLRNYKKRKRLKDIEIIAILSNKKLIQAWKFFHDTNSTPKVGIDSFLACPRRLKVTEHLANDENYYQ